MDADLVGVPELGALADEDIVLRAAQFLRDFGGLSQEELVRQLEIRFELYRYAVVDTKFGFPRSAVGELAGAALALFAVTKRDIPLQQHPQKTRVVRLPEREYQAFVVGRKRHVAFRRGVFSEPHEGDVLRLLEIRDGRWTARETLAEVLHVSTGETISHDRVYIVSIRPWRGAGTASAEEAELSARRESLAVAQEATEKLSRMLETERPHGLNGRELERRMARIILRALDKLVTLTLPMAQPMAAE